MPYECEYDTALLASELMAVIACYISFTFIFPHKHVGMRVCPKNLPEYTFEFPE